MNSSDSLFLLWFGLVYLFNGISTLFRLFNAKAILLEEQCWYYLTHSWEDKGVHTFPKGICPKVNVIARREYELAYYDSALHRFNHYTTRTPPFYSGVPVHFLFLGSLYSCFVSPLHVFNVASFKPMVNLLACQ